MIKKLISTIFSRGISFIAGFITLVLTARWLGPEGRGDVIAVTVLMSMVGTIGHFSLGPVWIREANLRKPDWMNHAIGFALFNTLSVFIILSVVIFLLYQFDAPLLKNWDEHLILIGVLLTPFIMLEYYALQLLMAQNKLELYNKYLIIGRGLGLLLLPILLIVLELSRFGFLITTIIAQAFIAILSMKKAMSGYSAFKLPALGIYKDSIKKSQYTHLTTFGTLIFSSGGIVMLNTMMDAKTAGVYQVAYQLITMLLILGQSASMVLYSKVADINDRESWIEQKKVIKYVMLLYFFLSLFAFILAPIIIPVIIGSDFNMSIELFRVLLVALMMFSFNHLMVHQWSVRGLYKQLAVVSLIAGGVNVMVNYLYIPVYGSFAVAWSFTLSCGITFIFSLLLYIDCNKKLFRYP